MTQPAHRRAAFARPEALALASIALLSIGIGMPALKQVREAAERMTCANNQRQIAIAAHNYHGDYMRLPPGYWGPLPNKSELKDGMQSQNVGCLVGMLPYLGHLYTRLITLVFKAQAGRIGPEWRWIGLARSPRMKSK